ncbi:P-loop containing nucleoside triphosphate hydrolases superfamily protein [Actinidia rufa]|uniref:P-loop containing nucleoside triphosphate hydrolases superfamily protein n=1 Tax=Actinidia rufa TaxID=165716 RepID=A0A7J0FJL6_9ERIC|nr:P-loop containing nucleoside triphosphate hydrolases superfamily protein [Actinidia rufa]
MPFISEAASAIKSRFGFLDQSSEPMPSVRSSPDLFKSAFKENLIDDHGEGSVNQSFELSGDPSFWKDHNVQVIIRIRPLSTSEISLQGNSKCVRQDSCQTITWSGHPESRFTFDLVADENVSQETLFKLSGLAMVDNCMGGYNSCMFAYGQTGSGKTHTMLGDIEGGTGRHSVNCGMTPRVFEYLFSRIQKIREDTKKGVYVDNLTEVEVTRARDVIQQLVQWEAQGVTHHRFARLNLVDLAGSERLVIMNLVNISNGKSLHVPYRDSKLTFLLQAIVNEDASGDVLTMRMQIQQLKARSMGELKTMKVMLGQYPFQGHQDPFNWEGLHGSVSPLITDKRASQKKECEVALVGAFRREKDKDIALQALAAENQAAMQLAKQRQDEIQGLKMRLRFREAGIKRLEAVASGKISAEMHLLKEKEELSKEIAVLRAQVDRNQEVTRFAMENLRLKEEIKRHKLTFRVNLQLLDALDWKLMHESDPSIVQKGNSDLATDMHHDGILVSSQELGSPWRTSINEENEFLRMQAIQNQSEMDMLHKKLNLCLEEKDRLERHVNDLVTELEAERSSKVQKEETQKLQIELPSVTADQIELKTMVDAIAAASQREAEAHETAIFLSKENEELRMKLKVLIEDNNKLIELYEQAVSENTDKGRGNVRNCQEYNIEDRSNHHYGEFANEKELVVKREVENLEHQLMEMHEENEKLMVLYEKAMQERDEFKRLFSSGGKNIVETKGEFNFPEKLVEVDGGENHKPDEYTVSLDVKLLSEETGFFGFNDFELEKPAGSGEGEALNAQDASGQSFENSQETDCVELDEPPSCAELNAGPFMQVEVESLKLKKFTLSDEGTMLAEETDFPSMEEQDVSSLHNEDPQEDTVNQIDVENDFDLEKKSLNLTTAKKAIAEVDDLSEEIEKMEDAFQMKQQEYAFHKLLAFEMVERRALVDRKLMALKYSLSSFSSSAGYFEQREVQARGRFNASLSYLDQKKEELACLQLHNLEKTDVPFAQRNWNLSGKATELLKSEEEKTKTQIEIKQAQEKLGTMRKEGEDLHRKFRKVENGMQVVQVEIQKGMKSVEEMDHKLKEATKEKDMVLEMQQNGSSEVENMIIDYHQCNFEAELKEEEIKILDEELQMELDRVTELQKAKVSATEKKSQLLGSISCDSCLEEIQDIRMSILDLKLFLGDEC